MIVSIFLYFKSKKIKALSYDITSINVLKGTTDKFRKLKVNFSGNEICNFTVSKISIWNSGNITINGQDISEADPLRIVGSDEIAILDAEIIYESKMANKVEFTIQDGVIYSTFDYIDQDEGAILKIYHNGTTSKDLTLLGSIKGIKQINGTGNLLRSSMLKSFDLIEKWALNDTIRRALVSGYFVVAPIFFLIYAIFFPKTIVPTQKNDIIAAVVLNVLLLPIGFILLRRRKPKEFEIFNKNWL